ncbi:MAG TPA: GntR family transcriptional regulator [Syntrophorhabdales bacterium]|nr:GntR family transcriptional regulator [Syntrophorhabdales bacterium]
MKKLIITDSTTIRKKVHAYLREQILSGEIGPQERLIEAKIAKDIGTSRTPVREALHTLEMEGLLESIPRVGYKVNTVSDQEVEEICEIRTVIETLAVRWAMEKAHARLVKELKKNIATAEQRVMQGEVKAYVDLDAQFHEIIAGLSGSRRLLELAQTLRRHMVRYRIQSIYAPDNVIRGINGHKEILAAIVTGDVETAAKAIRNHLEQSKKDILFYAFREHGEEKIKRRQT